MGDVVDKTNHYLFHEFVVKLGVISSHLLKITIGQPSDHFIDDFEGLTNQIIIGVNGALFDDLFDHPGQFSEVDVVEVLVPRFLVFLEDTLDQGELNAHEKLFVAGQDAF